MRVNKIRLRNRSHFSRIIGFTITSWYRSEMGDKSIFSYLHFRLRSIVLERIGQEMGNVLQFLSVFAGQRAVGVWGTHIPE